jgi:hypothetical protein
VQQQATSDEIVAEKRKRTLDFASFRPIATSLGVSTVRKKVAVQFDE